MRDACLPGTLGDVPTATAIGTAGSPCTPAAPSPTPARPTEHGHEASASKHVPHQLFTRAIWKITGNFFFFSSHVPLLNLAPKHHASSHSRVCKQTACCKGLGGWRNCLVLSEPATQAQATPDFGNSLPPSGLLEPRGRAGAGWAQLQENGPPSPHPQQVSAVICQDLAGHRGRRQGGPKRGDRQADKIKYKPRRDHGKRQHGRRPWERRRKKEKKKNKTSLSVSEGEEIEILAGQSRASEKQSGSVAGTVIPKGTEKENTAGPWLPCPLQTSLAEPGGEDGALNRRREVGCGRSLGRRQPARPLPPPVPTGGICTQRAPPDPGLHPGCKGHSELHGSPTSPHGAGAHVPTPSRPTSPWGSKPRKNLTSRVCPTRCDPLPEASERTLCRA